MTPVEWLEHQFDTHRVALLAAARDNERCVRPMIEMMGQEDVAASVSWPVPHRVRLRWSQVSPAGFIACLIACSGGPHDRQV
jgi:hypothetical protein